MNNFYIKTVIAKSDSKQDAIVQFKNGLNIIEGPSDTGKSCVLKCIEFVFGGNYQKLKNPFKESSKYNEAVIILSTDKYGDITISRKVGKGFVSVRCLSNTSISGDYAIKKPAKSVKNPKPTLTSLMLTLIGIDEEVSLPSNADFKKQRLTWENLLRLYYINEDSIDGPDPLFEPESTYEKTLFLSSLLYLLTGKDFNQTDAQTKSEIRKAKRDAIHGYVNNKIKQAHERKSELQSLLGTLEPNNPSESIQALENELQTIEDAINSAAVQSHDILVDIMELEKKDAEYDLLLSRLDQLESQYKADINRLSFITEGEVALDNIPKATTCPFCNGSIKPIETPSYLKASQAELKRIISQLNGLSKSKKDLLEEQHQIKVELSQLTANRDSIEEHIRIDLRPKVMSLKSTVSSYRDYIKVSNEVDFIKEIAQNWEDDLTDYDVKDSEESKDSLKYHPKEYFPADFAVGISKELDLILNECMYANYTSSRFDMKKFDIEINGESKSTHGKGYCSYLNTVVSLAFKNYFYKNAKFNANILIVDTPLHGFNEVDANMPNSMRNGLYQYLLNHQEGQLIIVENTDHLPTSLDLKSTDANLIHFTGGRESGRYGFLLEEY